jgi:hypothetical protein
VTLLRAHHPIFYIFLPGDKKSLLATNKNSIEKKHYYLFIGEIQPKSEIWKFETEMINYFLRVFNRQKVKERERKKKT